MERSWYWRLALIVGVLLFSVYQLIPSWHYFQLPPDQRTGEKFDKSVPRWAPDPAKHLNLGLDLQGGILLSMGVDVDRAVKAKIVRRADELGDFLREKKVTIDSAAPTGDGTRIEIRSADPAKVQSVVLDQYGAEMQAVSGAPQGATWLSFRPRAIQDFQVKAVEQAEKIIRNRVDKWGVSEPDIKRKANNQIQIQLPGFKDPDKAKELLGRTAQLEFKIADDESPVLDAVRNELPACEYVDRGLKLPAPETGCWTVEQIELPTGVTRQSTFVVANNRNQLEAAITKSLKPKISPNQEIGIGEGTAGQGPLSTRFYRTYLLRAKTELTGDYIADARAAVDQSDRGGQRPVVVFTMSAEGARLMERLTSENLGRRMATVLDAKVETAPYIQGKISSNGQITLGSGRDYQAMYQEANDIALVLKAGALPAPVTIFEERTVGATLGPELIKRGTTAALVGLLLVVLFMVAYYRMTGLIADLALVLNGLLVLAIMSILGSTLTLGMAVDANVLINERIREELRAGKTVRQSVEQGYDKVFWTIVDAHVTTLVAGLVLMQYGSGPVRGFAVTLIIGLVASMFTSIVVTRAFMDYFTRGDTARLSV
jgi:preprotein translocase subunit SecD